MGGWGNSAVVASKEINNGESNRNHFLSSPSYLLQFHLPHLFILITMSTDLHAPFKKCINK